MTGHYAALPEWKRDLRAQSAAARDQLSADQRERLSAMICRHAAEWLKVKDAASFMAYVSFRSEVDTRPLIRQAWETGQCLILPRVVQGSGEMDLHVIRSWDELAPGTYGILEPVCRRLESGTPDEVPLPVAVFVPGLAFDLGGGRLGYGRGYYDRLRASWEKRFSGTATRPVWIGLAYSMQLVPEVPMDEHDAFMDMLITENGVLYCREGE